MILVELCPLRKLKKRTYISECHNHIVTYILNISECHNHIVSLQCVYEMEYF